MTLSLGSSDGLYYVQVQRAIRSEILKTAQGNVAINQGDVRLDVELDLSNMSAGGYLLSYRHAGESWHHVLIVTFTHEDSRQIATPPYSHWKGGLTVGPDSSPMEDHTP
jgi:hypothetical protein